MRENKLRIVFFGTPDFAVASMEAIIASGHHVVAAVTAPDKPAGRGKHLMPPAVKTAALSHDIPVLQPEKLKDEAFVSELRALNADLFVVIAFRMLPEVVWTMPPMGTFNLHASLLPRYRGAAPINRAVMNGDTETGVTTFFLKHEIDTGDVLRQERVDITDDDDAGTVHDRLMELGARVTVETIDDIAAGRVTPRPQADFNDVEPCGAPKIFKDTCKIDWSRDAVKVRNHIRGLSPYPAAWTGIVADGSDAGTMKIFATRLTGEKAVEPGHVTIAPDRKSMTVDCGDEKLEILSLQPQGKRRMSADEYMRGCRYEKIEMR